MILILEYYSIKYHFFSDEFEFYSNHLKCLTLNDGNDCSIWSTTVKSVSNYGKCHTYLYNTEHHDHYIDMVKLTLFKYPSIMNEPFYMKTKFIFHSKILLPTSYDNQHNIDESRTSMN